MGSKKNSIRVEKILDDLTMRNGYDPPSNLRQFYSVRRVLHEDNFVLLHWPIPHVERTSPVQSCTENNLDDEAMNKANSTFNKYKSNHFKLYTKLKDLKPRQIIYLYQSQAQKLCGSFFSTKVFNKIYDWLEANKEKLNSNSDFTSSTKQVGDVQPLLDIVNSLSTAQIYILADFTHTFYRLEILIPQVDQATLRKEFNQYLRPKSVDQNSSRWYRFSKYFFNFMKEYFCKFEFKQSVIDILTVPTYHPVRYLNNWSIYENFRKIIKQKMLYKQSKHFKSHQNHEKAFSVLKKISINSSETAKTDEYITSFAPDFIINCFKYLANSHCKHGIITYNKAKEIFEWADQESRNFVKLIEILYSISSIQKIIICDFITVTTKLFWSNRKEMKIRDAANILADSVFEGFKKDLLNEVSQSHIKKKYEDKIKAAYTKMIETIYKEPSVGPVIVATIKIDEDVATAEKNWTKNKK